MENPFVKVKFVEWYTSTAVDNLMVVDTLDGDGHDAFVGYQQGFWDSAKEWDTRLAEQTKRYIESISKSEIKINSLEKEVAALKQILTTSSNPVAWVTKETAAFFGKLDQFGGEFQYTKTKFFALDEYVERDYNIPLYLGDNLGES